MFCMCMNMYTFLSQNYYTTEYFVCVKKRGSKG